MLNDQAKELKHFLDQIPELTDAERLELMQWLIVHQIPKGTMLEQAGQLWPNCYFVLKGCLRQYLLQDGTEHTTAFYTEGMAAAQFPGASGEDFLQTTEESLLIVGELAAIPAMQQRMPNLEKMTMRMLEHDLGNSRQEQINRITLKPEQRYQQLLEKRPDLFQRVPMHQIASYLGITAESLSRLRKRLLKRTN